MGIGAAIASIVLGARVIEKHFTLSRKDGGADSAFSIEPEELKNLIIESERAFLALGQIQYGIQEAELKSLLFKRSIYVIDEIKKGQLINRENIKVLRPNYGLSPKLFDFVLNKKVTRDIKPGTPLKWEHLLE